MRACAIHTQLGRIAVAAGRAVGGVGGRQTGNGLGRLVQITTGTDLGAHIGDAVGGDAAHVAACAQA